MRPLCMRCSTAATTVNFMSASLICSHPELACPSCQTASSRRRQGAQNFGSCLARRNCAADRAVRGICPCSGAVRKRYGALRQRYSSHCQRPSRRGMHAQPRRYAPTWFRSLRRAGNCTAPECGCSCMAMAGSRSSLGARSHRISQPIGRCLTSARLCTGGTVGRPTVAMGCSWCRLSACGTAQKLL